MTKSIEFTLKVSNCLSCSYCPQSKLNVAYTSPKTTMTLEDFKTILNKLPWDCRCDFSGFSECFLNPHACDMIGEAISWGHETFVFSTLMGMKQGCVDVLKYRRPNLFKIHVPDPIGLQLPEEKWVEQHELFLKAGLPAQYMAMSPPSDFIKRYLAIHNIPLELPPMLSRGGNLTNVPVTELKGPIRCTMNRWHSNVVLPNGDVVGDCHDYGLTVRLGNLLAQPYQDIYDAAERWKVNMEKDATGTICAKCGWSQNA